MAEPDPTWNPPRGPRNRHPRGCEQGSVPASNSSTPAPRTLQSHMAGHNLSTQNPQRSSDPLRYNTQSTPHWDDANGATRNMPSTPSRKSAPSYAQADRKSHGTLSQQQNSSIQIPPRATFNNPYLDIVGDGPYGHNQAMYTAAGIAGAASIEKKTNRRDFTPYFDAADARNSADLGSPKRDGFRNAFAKKDVNQKLCQETTDSIKAATAKRGTVYTEKLSEPRIPPRAFSGQQPSATPTTFRSNFEFPASPKTPKAGAVPASKPAGHQWPGTLSPVVEAPSPLKVPSNNQPNPPSKHKRNSTLDRILNLRTEEQAKALAQLEGELEKGNKLNEDHRQVPHALSRRISDLESQRITHPTSREEKRQASELVASPGSPETQRWKDISTMADPVAPTKTASVSSSVYSSDENTQEDEIDRLSKAIAGLRPFQDLPSSSPNKAGFQRKSAVPDGLDMSKIGVGKGEAEDGSEVQQARREKTLEQAQVELLEYFNVPLEATGLGKAGAQTSQESSSQESFATASSEDYEKVGVKEEGELVTEQNGGKRRWYKGFRKA